MGGMMGDIHGKTVPLTPQPFSKKAGIFWGMGGIQPDGWNDGRYSRETVPPNPQPFSKKAGIFGERGGYSPTRNIRVSGWVLCQRNSVIQTEFAVTGQSWRIFLPSGAEILKFPRFLLL